MSKAPKRKQGYTAKQIARVKALDPKIDKAPFTQELINEVVKRAAVDRQNALIAEVVKRLEAQGITFNDPSEIEPFFKERLSIGKVNEMNYVYLDYVDESNQGTLILCYSENMEVETK